MGVDWGEGRENSSSRRALECWGWGHEENQKLAVLFYKPSEPLWLIWNEDIILILHPAPVNFLSNCFVSNFCICKSLLSLPTFLKEVCYFLTGYSHSKPLSWSTLRGSELPQQGHHVIYPLLLCSTFVSQTQGKSALSFLSKRLPDLRPREILIV